MNLAYKSFPIYEIATIENVKDNVLYNNCISLQMGATDGQMELIKKPKLLGGRKSAIRTAVEWLEVEYLYLALCREMPRFLARYKQNINIRLKDLKHIVLDIHLEKETRQFIINANNSLDEAETLERKTLDRLKNIKEFYMRNMFIN